MREKPWEKRNKQCHFYEGEPPMIGGYDEYVLACPNQFGS